MPTGLAGRGRGRGRGRRGRGIGLGGRCRGGRFGCGLNESVSG